MSGSPHPGEAEGVPVRDRLRAMQLVRAAGVGLVLLCSAVLPRSLEPGRREAILATAVYAGVVLAAEALVRTRRGEPVVVFSALLILDGVWLAWAGYLTGGLTSPLVYAVLLHLAAAALLGSYRTGLKLALWHSLLLVGVYDAERGGVLYDTDLGLPHGGTQGQRLAVFVVVLWLVAVSTATLSAVNERELRRRRADLEALTGLAERLERTQDAQGVADALLGAATATYGAARGVVLAGPDGLPLLAGVGLQERTAGWPGRQGPSAVVARAHELHRSVLVTALDPEVDPWLSRLLPDARDLLVVPLSAEGRPVGALVLERGVGGRPVGGFAVGGRSAGVQRRVVATLERSASYAALALRNAWLLEQVRRLAATDGLTKIANRRTFESTLEREVARAVRNAEHLSLVMLDLDHFKALNDTHGHQAGDEVLRNVAAALSCECRDFDTPARYGGEEFAVVLPGCGPDEALVIAERLRCAVAAAPAAVPVTASAGVASFPAHAGDADTLVRAADDALYRSKSEGRNRTTQGRGVPPEEQVDALLRRAVAQRLSRDPGAGLPLAPP